MKLPKNWAMLEKNNETACKAYIKALYKLSTIMFLRIIYCS